MLAAFVALLFPEDFRSRQLDAVRAAFSAVGVVGPLRVEDLACVESAYGHEYCTMGVRANRGRRYVAEFSPSGRVSALRLDADRFVPPRQQLATRDEVGDRVVRHWLAKLAPRETTRDAGATDLGDGRVRVYFKRLRNGYPFIGDGGRYTYGFTYTKTDHSFLEFFGNEDVPPADANPPRLSASDAVAAVDRFLAGHPQPRGVSWRTVGTPELGYYPPTGAGLARLGWLVSCRLDTSGQTGSFWGREGWIVDARTGDVLTWPTFLGDTR